jgi:hypothetical protein
LLDSSRELVMGLEGVFYGFGFWKMMPASNILYNILWVQEDERKARIQQKK